VEIEMTRIKKEKRKKEKKFIYIRGREENTRDRLRRTERAS
jgi:hypothetical protein